MFDNIMKIFKKIIKKGDTASSSKDTAKERLHLVLMQDRANVSADFLDLMKQEIIEVIKKYIDVDETAIDVRLTNKENEDGTNGAPALYANIPIINIKDETKKLDKKLTEKKDEQEETFKKQEKIEKEEIKQAEYKTEKNNIQVKEENNKANVQQENKVEQQEEIEKKEIKSKKE